MPVFTRETRLLVLPPQRTYLETMRRIKRVTARIAAALEIHGPFNIQFIAKDNEVKVIECNLRASRSFPFVSKILKVNFIDLATRVIMGESVRRYNGSVLDVDYVGVKAPQFSFMRLDGADPTLGVEMASTGEVGCLGDDFEEAFLKLAVGGYRFPFRTFSFDRTHRGQGFVSGECARAQESRRYAFCHQGNC